MKTRVLWSMSFAGWQNRMADANLVHFTGTDTTRARAVYRLAAAVRQAAGAVLNLAYLDLSRGIPPAMREHLATIQDYASQPGMLDRVVLPPASAPSKFRGDDARAFQRQLRDALARLVLGFDADGVDGGYWDSPPLTLALHFVRTGPYVLSDVKALREPWGASLLACVTVLQLAVPWFRYCALCGKVFFKVKRKLLCSSACARVYQARKRSRKDPLRPRGPQRRDVAGRIVEMHNAWLAASRASTDRADRGRRREGQKSGARASRGAPSVARRLRA